LKEPPPAFLIQQRGGEKVRYGKYNNKRGFVSTPPPPECESRLYHEPACLTFSSVQLKLNLLLIDISIAESRNLGFN